MKLTRRSHATLAHVLLVLLLTLSSNAGAQIYDPVQWELEIEPAETAPGSTVLARLTATIEDGWHIYSTTTPEGIALTLEIAESEALVDWRPYQPSPEVVYDPNFQADVEWYTSSAEFLFELDLAATASGGHAIEAKVRYGACDYRQCLPPKRKSASAEVRVGPDLAIAAMTVPAGYQPARQVDRSPPSSGGSRASSGVTEALGSDDVGLAGFSLLALGFGLLAILTPCVFPMIPVYMSSFMDGGQRSWGATMRQAGTFCLGVVMLFTALGGVLSAILGPFGLSQIGANPWINLLIAGFMCVFALSMLGAFEISIPSSWTTGASERSAGTGVVATLMLSLVFTLASFACTGPFIGALLADSVSRGSAAYYPVLGMALFSTGLAAPFMALALFPALLTRLPRSGGWMAMSKRVVGIVVLAVALKYCGIVDGMFGWGILSRERFLAIWIVLFAAAALYLWGVLRHRDDGPPEGVGLVRLGVGTLFMALAISLVPGMFGGGLGELEAHVPEASVSGMTTGSDGLEWAKDDYEGAFARAQAEGKTLLVSFTGYACSNCKWMKANMFTRPEIVDLAKQMVLVELYTDGFDEASERHQQMQVDRFQSSGIPFYVLIQPDGSVVATFAGQTRDTEEFREFMQSAS